jgi:hypothetical protein
VPFSCTSFAASSRPGHGGAIERGGEADALHAGGFELGLAEGLALDADHEVERLLQRARDLLHRREIGQAGRHQHVGARRLEGLQALDDVVEVGFSAQEAFCARRQHERKRERVSGVNRSFHPTAAVSRSNSGASLLPVASSIEPPTRPTACRLPDGLGRRVGRIAKTLLEIADHRQVDRFGDGAGIRQRLLTRHLAIALAQHAGLGTTRRCQRLEAEAGQQARRACIPRIGNDERARRLMQCAQLLRLVGLTDAHAVSSRFGCYRLRPSTCLGESLATSTPSTQRRFMPTISEPSGPLPSA